MKRIISVFMCCILMFSCLPAVAEQAAYSTDEMCRTAIAMMKEIWKNEIFMDDSDGYFEVAHTRVINLYEANEDEKTAKYLQEYFTNESGAAMTAFVECTLFTDYFSSSPYYSDVMIHHCVAFYADGTAAVLAKSPVEIFRTRSFETQYDGIIKAIIDLDGMYNEVCYLK